MQIYILTYLFFIKISQINPFIKLFLFSCILWGNGKNLIKLNRYYNNREYT